MVYFRERLGNRIICGFMFEFWTVCLSCWFMLFAIYEIVFLSKFFIYVLPRTAVPLLVVCYLASVTRRFFINFCNYHFTTQLSDFVRKNYILV
jgi:hypothetical protein